MCYIPGLTEMELTSFTAACITQCLGCGATTASIGNRPLVLSLAEQCLHSITAFSFFPALPSMLAGAGQEAGRGHSRDSWLRRDIPYRTASYSIVFSRKTGVVKKEGSKRKELPSKVAVAQGQARHQPALFFFPLFWSPIKLLSRTMCCLAFPILSPVLWGGRG